jgi:hypothetical protein
MRYISCLVYNAGARPDAAELMIIQIKLDSLLISCMYVPQYAIVVSLPLTSERQKT